MFDRKQISTPVRVQGLEKVRLIAVGAFHNLALIEDRILMAWGCNEYGQLGTCDTQPRSQPIPVQGLSGLNLVDIAAGGWHSTALTDEGEVYSWGRREHGRLGFGVDKSSKMVPQRVQYLAGENIVQKIKNPNYKGKWKAPLIDNPADLPMIDIALLSSPPPACDEELEKLKTALYTWGCFQATDHRIPNSYLDTVRSVARQFFELPVEQKQQCFRPSANDDEGYGGDIIYSGTVLDWCDRLSLTLLPEDERRFELWPKTPTHFREVLHEYSMKMKEILEFLFRAIAKLLNLEEDCFLKQFGERALLMARNNFYPPCPKPNDVHGLKPHSDKSGITVLLQDKEIEGLHILKDNQWYKVPVIPYGFVVNAGDQMQIMTNGMIKSPVHRVVTNPEKLRISVLVANEAERDKEIGPEEGLITEKTPRLYKNVNNFGNYCLECYQKGVVAIETIRI